MTLAQKLRHQWLVWVWLVLVAVDVFWELSAFFVHGTSWDHLTLSQVIKRWEGIDPVTGRPVDTPVGIVKRVVVAVLLVAVAVALFLHWVVQLF